MSEEESKKRDWLILLLVGLGLDLLLGGLLHKLGKYFILIGLYEWFGSSRGNKIIGTVISVIVLLIYLFLVNTLAGIKFGDYI